jgi:hypothetical protein
VSKTIIVGASLTAVFVAAIATLWVSAAPMRACEALPVASSLADLRKALGEPRADGEWVYFKSTPLAAGKISAKVVPGTETVLLLRCQHDGSDTWATNP